MTGTSSGCDTNEPRGDVEVSNTISGGMVTGVQTGTVSGDITIHPEPQPQQPTVPGRNWVPPAARRWTPEPAALALLNWAASEVLTGTQPTPLVVISGAYGVGKTQLALHWAQLHRGMFLGGSLFADAGPMIMPNGDAMPASPMDILADWLHRVGAPPVADDTVHDLGLRRSYDAWRSRTGRLDPILTIVDDAVSAAQVRCLLHGGLTLVTSRYRLSGLWDNGAVFLAYEESGWVHVRH